MNAPAKYSGIQPAFRHSFLRIHHRADDHYRENPDRANIVHQQGWTPLLLEDYSRGVCEYGAYAQMPASTSPMNKPRRPTLPKL